MQWTCRAVVLIIKPIVFNVVAVVVVAVAYGPLFKVNELLEGKQLYGAFQMLCILTTKKTNFKVHALHESRMIVNGCEWGKYKGNVIYCSQRIESLLFVKPRLNQKLKNIYTETTCSDTHFEYPKL